MARSKASLLADLIILGTGELRTLNRYHLHPLDQRCCGKCRLIHTGIAEHFHVKKHYPDGTVGYNIWCKFCKNNYNKALLLDYRTNAPLFIRAKFPGYRARAKEQGLLFNLTPEYLIDRWDQQAGRCFYTNEPICFTNTVRKLNAPHLMTPSLDRMDPAKGYTMGNVVWCSYKINRMKNEFSYVEFLRACTSILETRGKYDD